MIQKINIDKNSLMAIINSILDELVYMGAIIKLSYSNPLYLISLFRALYVIDMNFSLFHIKIPYIITDTVDNITLDSLYSHVGTVYSFCRNSLDKLSLLDSEDYVDRLYNHLSKVFYEVDYLLAKNCRTFYEKTIYK